MIHRHQIDQIKTGINIRAMRIDAGFQTATEFAKVIGATESMVCSWEAGLHKPTADSLYRMSIALDCYIDDIIVGKEAGDENKQDR